MKVEVLYQAGGKGHSVSLVRRSDTPHLNLRWWDPSRGEKGNWRYVSLEHTDVEEGESACLEAAAVRRRGKTRETEGVLSLAELLARYESAKSNRKKPRQRKADLHRMDLALEFYRAPTDALTIDPDRVAEYVEWRRDQGISDTTIGHEIVFLRGVMAWAAAKRDTPDRMLLRYDPLAELRGTKRLRSLNPKTPVAERRDYLAVRRFADRVDRQGLLRPLLVLAHEHGWRLTAWLELWASDFDFRTTEETPFGRILRRVEVDKMGKGGWRPMTMRSRRAAMLLLRRSAAIGNTHLFRAPVADGRWQEQHALDLLHRVERLATDELRREHPEMPAIELGGFHALRRKWATDRKHLPIPDVAYAGDWDEATLLIYLKGDPKTTRDVTLYRRTA